MSTPDVQAILDRICDSHVVTLLYDHPELKTLPIDSIVVIFQAGMRAGVDALSDVWEKQA